MTEAVDLPFYGKFGRKLIQKEDLVGSFREVMAKAGVQVHEKTKLTGIDGAKGNFLVTTNRGVVGAKRVVLAIGRRGTPRTMDVPGEDSQKVAYRLVDPRQYAGKRVLVVGGGDSALEAAIQLADESDATQRDAQAMTITAVSLNMIRPHSSSNNRAEFPAAKESRRSEERRVGKECRSRW